LRLKCRIEVGLVYIKAAELRRNRSLCGKKPVILLQTHADNSALQQRPIAISVSPQKRNPPAL
jgi:hypothetical protein